MTRGREKIAWIEGGAGERISLRGSIVIGRGGPNDLNGGDGRVSRRHAWILAQGEGQFRSVEHGSRKGTCRNGRRVQPSMRLVDGDELQASGAACEALAAGPVPCPPGSRALPGFAGELRFLGMPPAT